jgi:hypothetical protein
VQARLYSFRISFSGQQDVGVVSGELVSVGFESSDVEFVDIHEVSLPCPPYSSIFL